MPLVAKIDYRLFGHQFAHGTQYGQAAYTRVEYPNGSAMIGHVGNDKWEKGKRKEKSGCQFETDGHSCDYSLSAAFTKALNNFRVESWSVIHSGCHCTARPKG